MRRVLPIVLALLAWPSSASADPLSGIRIAPPAKASYERVRDYGQWLRMHAPYNRCFNVRDQVLSDESRTRVRLKQPVTGWRCTIVRGTWHDPYSAIRFTDPKALDVDHVVPLKEAHLSGAHRWPRERRVEYASFLRDPHHLIAVSASENRRKGDRDPPNYMPPNPAYHCTYLRHWIAVKRKWILTMDRAEAQFIRRRLGAC